MMNKKLIKFLVYGSVVSGASVNRGSMSDICYFLNSNNKQHIKYVKLVVINFWRKRISLLLIV